LFAGFLLKVVELLSVHCKEYACSLETIGVEDSLDRGIGEHVPLPQIREKYFSDNYHVKFWNFSCKYHVNSGVLLIYYT